MTWNELERYLMHNDFLRANPKNIIVNPPVEIGVEEVGGVFTCGKEGQCFCGGSRRGWCERLAVPCINRVTPACHQFQCPRKPEMPLKVLGGDST